MRFYNQRHQFYCGIDLHASSMHVCVVDHEGDKRLHRNFPTRSPTFRTGTGTVSAQRSDCGLRIHVQLVLAG